MIVGMGLNGSVCISIQEWIEGLSCCSPCLAGNGPLDGLQLLTTERISQVYPTSRADRTTA